MVDFVNVFFVLDYLRDFEVVNVYLVVFVCLVNFIGNFFFFCYWYFKFGRIFFFGLWLVGKVFELICNVV